MNRTKTKHRSRKGASLVELAVCLPVLVTLTLGSIEISNFIHLKQSVTAAAYEASREAIRRNGSTATAEAAATAVLTARRIDEVTIDISPGVDVARGQLITVSVTADSSSNRVLVPRFVDGLEVTATATMVKE